MKTYIVSCISYYTGFDDKFYLEKVHPSFFEGNCRVDLEWTNDIYKTRCFCDKQTANYFIKEIKAKLNNKSSIVRSLGLHDTIKDLKVQKIEINIKELD